MVLNTQILTSCSDHSNAHAIKPRSHLPPPGLISSPTCVAQEVKNSSSPTGYTCTPDPANGNICLTTEMCAQLVAADSIVHTYFSLVVSYLDYSKSGARYTYCLTSSVPNQPAAYATAVGASSACVGGCPGNVTESCGGDCAAQLYAFGTCSECVPVVESVGG